MVAMDRPTPLLLTVPEAAALLSIGRAKMYQLIARGDIKSVRIDGARRLRRADVEEYVASLTA